jgi:hypothetical protein
MFKFEPDDEWKTHDSNVQTYRSNFFSTQSILLAVVAIILDKNNILTIIISIISLFQMWYIWFRVISTRIFIVDYYKYGMNKIFDNNGNYIPLKTKCNDYLHEDIYATDKKIRNKINKNITELWGRKTKFGKNLKFNNFRLTRVKLDILIPISITLIWIFFLTNAFLKLVDKA